VYEWILAAWCSVCTEIVEKRFKVSRISSEMDGSEYFVTMILTVKVGVIIMVMIAMQFKSS
jgi:hypothetical protein